MRTFLFATGVLALFVAASTARAQLVCPDGSWNSASQGLTQIGQSGIVVDLSAGATIPVGAGSAARLCWREVQAQPTRYDIRVEIGLPAGGATYASGHILRIIGTPNANVGDVYVNNPTNVPIRIEIFGNDITRRIGSLKAFRSDAVGRNLGDSVNYVEVAEFRVAGSVGDSTAVPSTVAIEADSIFADIQGDLYGKVMIWGRQTTGSGRGNRVPLLKIGGDLAGEIKAEFPSAGIQDLDVGGTIRGYPSQGSTSLCMIDVPGGIQQIRAAGAYLACPPNPATDTPPFEIARVHVFDQGGLHGHLHTRQFRPQT